MNIEQEFPIGGKFIVKRTIPTERSRICQYIGKEVEIIGHFRRDGLFGVVFIDDGGLGVGCGLFPDTFLTPAP